MVKRDEISRRQLMVLVVTALLMPATALLPTMTTRLAGSAGWLSALGALPILLAAGWAAKGIDAAEGKGTGAVLRNIVIIMYMLWTFLLLVVCLRLSGARLEKIYGGAAASACAAAMLLVAVWMAVGKISAFARAGEIFYLALAVLLAGVLLLAAFKIEAANFSVRAQEVLALPKSSVAAAGLLLNVYPATVLMGKTAPSRKSKGREARWITVFCAAMTLLLGAVTGCLGPELTGRIASPFLIMVQGLGVQGVFQRAEALIIAVWTLSDLMLSGLLLHTWRALANRLRAGKWSRWSVVPVAAAALIGAWALFFDVERLWQFCSTVLPVLGILLGLVCPILIRSMVLVSGKHKKR